MALPSKFLDERDEAGRRVGNLNLRSFQAFFPSGFLITTLEFYLTTLF